MAENKWIPASGLCEMCGEVQAAEWHHLFPQTKLNKKLYGELIHKDINIIGVCHRCHESATHMSEREVCEKLGIPTRSKSGKL